MKLWPSEEQWTISASSGGLGQEFGPGIFKHTGPTFCRQQFFRKKVIV
jgi:hypothetical protein